MEAWFREQAAHFQQLPAERQQPFVATQIDRVQRWGILPWLLGSGSGHKLALTDLLKLNQLLTTWTKRAPEHERDHLQLLTDQIRRYLLTGTRATE